MLKLTIDGRETEVAQGGTVLDAARTLGIDIPTLCYLEKCGPATSCLACVVKVDGKLVPSCATKALPGMRVESETTEVREARRTALELLFSDHVGDCLSPCHRLCPLQLNVPVMLRQVDAGAVEEAVATVRQALPLPAVLGRLCNHPCEQGCRRGAHDEPAAIREVECFVADHDLQSTTPYTIPRKPATGRSAAIIGAGPCGLAAAFYLALQGHSVTIFDRHERAGGSLRDISETELSRSILDAEIARIGALGVTFRFGAELGGGIALPDIQRDFSAVLLSVGELASGEGAALGVATAGKTIASEVVTFQTNLPGVFAAGSAAKPVKHIVRAMTEGRAAAECIGRFLRGEAVMRDTKPFSSVMGRIEPAELQLFLKDTNPDSRHSPCDMCVKFSANMAQKESRRCLHCDCRSSGHCAFQYYAQIYGANAGRYRTGQRAPFEQQVQPGGVLFEPGKCILCGICVRLTEMAREPLGLTFIGRGFDVRIAAPFNEAVEKGMQTVAADCVRHCPTGALAFK